MEILLVEFELIWIDCRISSLLATFFAGFGNPVTAAYRFLSSALSALTERRPKEFSEVPLCEVSSKGGCMNMHPQLEGSRNLSQVIWQSAVRNKWRRGASEAVDVSSPPIALSE